MLDPETIQRARATLVELVEGSREIAENTALYDLEPTHRPDAPRVRRIKHPHRQIPFFAEIARLPKLVATIAQLVGPSVRIFSSKINIKEPFIGSPIEWHQDWAFYPHTNEDLVAVGVMLEDCNDENGPMLVIPGSHRGPVYDHHADGVFGGAIDPTQMNGLYNRAVALTGPAGSVSFHHVRTVHGSAQNSSPFPRPLLLFAYAAADAWPLMGISDFAKFDAGLISGEPSAQARMENLPVRMPFPRPPREGSIYENQAAIGHARFFEIKPPPDV